MEPTRILVVLPNWVGDVAMATPALSALRRRFRQSHMILLARPYVADLLQGADWMDEILLWPGGQTKTTRREGFARLACELRRRRIDLAVLLANSFRSALLASLAGARQRVGYDRDGRGLLLTDRLVAQRLDGDFVPVPMVRYYNAIAAFLGCREFPEGLVLPAGPEDDRRFAEICRQYRVGPKRPLVVVNPGAAYGQAKCWLPARFAELSDRLIDTQAAQVVVTCGPGEVSIARRIEANLRREATVLADDPLSLRQLMGLIRRCDLLVTNDSGPRHIAAAYGVPVVSIFGPTDPRWSETGYPLERKVIADVDCTHCMKRVCPTDHRCMRALTVEMVLGPASELLAARRVSPVSPGPPDDGRAVDNAEQKRA
ncbi:MAG TPA: lipopolysaccharide heptosyltransferase II [Phycisphaerae bacterium]|nr:lipopolysaccharide heptosyltransferase II [Phycisphaerae bacterium]